MVDEVDAYLRVNSLFPAIWKFLSNTIRECLWFGISGNINNSKITVQQLSFKKMG